MLTISPLTFATVIGIDVALHIRKRRTIKKYKNANAQMYVAILALAQMQEYLSSLLDENGVEITEFDRIALNTIVSQIDES